MTNPSPQREPFFSTLLADSSPAFNACDETTVTYSYTVVAHTPPNKAACKRGGWRSYTDDEGTSFANQGDCISYIASGGRNKANG